MLVGFVRSRFHAVQAGTANKSKQHAHGCAKPQRLEDYKDAPDLAALDEPIGDGKTPHDAPDHKVGRVDGFLLNKHP